VKKSTVLLFLFLTLLSGKAQSYKFFSYDVANGLCEKFAYTMNQDSQGFLWIGTGKGLCRFDGVEFESEFPGDTIPRSLASSSMLDSRGRLWFGHENGMITLVENGEATAIEPAEGLKSYVRGFQEDQDGNVLALLQQSGIMKISPELDITYYGGDPLDEANPFIGKFLNCFTLLEEGDVMVGTNDGLYFYRYDPSLESFVPTGDLPEMKYLVVQEIVPAQGDHEYWIGTEDEGVYSLVGRGVDPQAWEAEKIGVDIGLGYARVSSIVFDGTRRAWVADNGTGIYRIELDEEGKPVSTVLFHVGSGIPNEYINEIFIDEEGNQWFSSNGNGIAVLRDQAFTFYPIWQEESMADVTALYIRGEDHWMGGMNRLAHYEGDVPLDVTYFGTGNGLPIDKVTALYQDEAGDLFIGTERSGLYRKSRGSSRIRPLYISGNSLENNINAIDGKADSIFVATYSGVYTLNTRTGKRFSYSTLNGLPHNKVNDVLVDSNGVAWVATITSGLIGINPHNGVTQILLDGKPHMELRSLAADDQGVIWAGTDGDGVFKFHSDSLVHYSEEDGLLSNFCYAMGVDPNGYVWVGHRDGLSRIDPRTENIRFFGKESGFNSDIVQNAVVRSNTGRLLLGSTDGIIQYDAFQAREDSVAPRLSLKSVVISDVPYDPTQDIKLKYGRYRVRIDFVGINLSNPEQVRYQYRMKNYTDEWSDPSTLSYADFPRVEDGNFVFQLRACDGNGNCSELPLELAISVKLPIWKTWWFILSSVFVVIATIFIVFKIRERNQKAIQEYLQRQLDERTREVVQQKEEIEIKNRDITDSINYAQRIQASILPPIKKLHDAFDGSFVFYQPRDIVSGDFYWYEHMGDDRFIVVCADSTGHGVPGAFMSMIGTTLIKDISQRAGVTTPSQVLTTLDNEVRESLNQNQETSGSNDGMDIIVAEIDMKSLKFTVSSAMRPVIIYSGGEQIYVKGSRSSVGGQLDEDRVEKEFIDQEYQLKKGDIIYMFSDGYPDQFGGPLGRKFKMVRLKNLLRDIHDKPMDEQYNYIKSNFFLWKEDLEQVDDVLFMGIRV